MPKKSLTEEQEIEICEKYQKNNLDCKFYGKEYNVSSTTIIKALKKYGVERRGNAQLKRKYKVDENYFSKINTEEKAYFLGILYADGSNYTPLYSISLGLQGSDKDILFKLHKIIQPDRPISEKLLESGKMFYTMNISSKTISKQLCELGCVKAKSLILSFPSSSQVPHEFIRHFIRGYLDGDGCISKQVVSIVSTEQFCKKMKEIISEHLNINSYVGKFRKDLEITQSIRISGRKQMKIFLDWIYQDATIYMERKYQKYLDLLDWKPCIPNHFLRNENGELLNKEEKIQRKKEYDKERYKQKIKDKYQNFQ